MHTWKIILLLVLVLLALVGLLAILFFIGYRKKVAGQAGGPAGGQDGEPSRFTAYQTNACQHVPGHIYKKPDPMIYCQQYLISQGLAVTWNNPDIHLEQGGVVVDSHALLPATTYDVIARIWNNSLDAVVVGMPVSFSYLSFGIGGGKSAIATTPVDIAAKGAAGCPGFARVQWTTPPTPGHYCLVVEFAWADDANPLNNVGQHNTDVRPLNSPRAKFVFPVRNEARTRREIALRIDSYTLPALAECAGRPAVRSPRPTRQQVVRRLREIAAANSARGFPVPAGWTVTVTPEALVLAPEEERQVTVDVLAPDGFTGRRSFNVTGFSGSRPAGGVTLTVTG